ncbi:MAG: hypothetical protein J7L53_06190, partial [Deltaproteobacteria bacterium]|nr:hypothetical protein [Deltaproteobacteria bacterium]
MKSVDIDVCIKRIRDLDPVQVRGKVTNIVGLVVQGHGPGSAMGGMCEIYSRDMKKSIMAEVVGFRDKHVLLMPLGDLDGIGPGSSIVARRSSPTVKLGNAMLGRVIDGLGRPLDEKGFIDAGEEMSLYGNP